jgi:hypothetical protein
MKEKPHFFTPVMVQRVTDDRMTSYVCYCFRKECENIRDVEDMYCCFNCNAYYYCSQECLKEDWEMFHKHECSLDPAALAMLLETSLGLMGPLIRIFATGWKMPEELQLSSLLDVTKVSKYFTDHATRVQAMVPLQHKKEDASMWNKEIADLTPFFFALHSPLFHITYGYAFYHYFTWLNHSCDPNCHWFGEGKKVRVKAARPIKKGDELTIAYVPSELHDSYINRKSTFKTVWGFKCTCHRCLYERDLMISSSASIQKECDQYSISLDHDIAFYDRMDANICSLIRSSSLDPVSYYDAGEKNQYLKIILQADLLVLKDTYFPLLGTRMCLFADLLPRTLGVIPYIIKPLEGIRLLSSLERIVNTLLQFPHLVTGYVQPWYLLSMFYKSIFTDYLVAFDEAGPTSFVNINETVAGRSSTTYHQAKIRRNMKLKKKNKEIPGAFNQLIDPFHQLLSRYHAYRIITEWYSWEALDMDIMTMTPFDLRSLELMKNVNEAATNDPRLNELLHPLFDPYVKGESIWDKGFEDSIYYFDPSKYPADACLRKWNKEYADKQYCSHNPFPTHPFVVPSKKKKVKKNKKAKKQKTEEMPLPLPVEEDDLDTYPTIICASDKLASFEEKEQFLRQLIRKNKRLTEDVPIKLWWEIMEEEPYEEPLIFQGDEAPYIEEQEEEEGWTRVSAPRPSQRKIVKSKPFFRK